MNILSIDHISYKDTSVDSSDLDKFVRAINNAQIWNTTCMYYPPTFDEKGRIITPDGNISTTTIEINNKSYKVSHQGWITTVSNNDNKILLKFNTTPNYLINYD